MGLTPSAGTAPFVLWTAAQADQAPMPGIVFATESLWLVEWKPSGIGPESCSPVTSDLNVDCGGWPAKAG